MYPIFLSPPSHYFLSLSARLNAPYPCLPSKQPPACFTFRHRRSGLEQRLLWASSCHLLGIAKSLHCSMPPHPILLWQDRCVPALMHSFRSPGRSGTPRTLWLPRLVQEALSMSSAPPSASPSMRPSSRGQHLSLLTPQTPSVAASAINLVR